MSKSEVAGIQAGFNAAAAGQQASQNFMDNQNQNQNQNTTTTTTTTTYKMTHNTQIIFWMLFLTRILALNLIQKWIM